MKPNQFLALSMLAALASGCVSEHVPTSLDYNPQYYFNLQFPPDQVSNGDGQQKHAAPGSPAVDPIVDASSTRHGDELYCDRSQIVERPTIQTECFAPEPGRARSPLRAAEQTSGSGCLRRAEDCTPYLTRSSGFEAAMKYAVQTD